MIVIKIDGGPFPQNHVFKKVIRRSVVVLVKSQVALLRRPSSSYRTWKVLSRKLWILNKRITGFELKMKILSSLLFATPGFSRELRFKKRFDYPDPVLDRESLFCPIDELFENSALVEVLLAVWLIQFL